MMENNTLSGTLPSEIASMELLEKFTVQDNQLSGTLPYNIGDLTYLNWWDTFGNKLEGDMPSSIQNLGSLDYLYIQNEHSDALLNYYCKQRIESSAIGRKFNWQVLANEYYNYKYNSFCAIPTTSRQLSKGCRATFSVAVRFGDRTFSIPARCVRAAIREL